MIATRQLRADDVERPVLDDALAQRAVVRVERSLGEARRAVAVAHDVRLGLERELEVGGGGDLRGELAGERVLAIDDVAEPLRTVAAQRAPQLDRHRALRALE